MVRPTKKFTDPAPRGAQPEQSPTRLHKDKYFESAEQRRSKYDGRASSASLPETETPVADEPTIEIVIDLRDDSLYADAPQGEHYYLRVGGGSN